MSPTIDVTRLLRRCATCRRLYRKATGRPPRGQSSELCPTCNASRAAAERAQDDEHDAAWIERTFAQAKATNRRSGRFRIQDGDGWRHSTLARAGEGR
jgi:hypothetical protein